MEQESKSEQFNIQKVMPYLASALSQVTGEDWKVSNHYDNGTARDISDPDLKRWSALVGPNHKRLVITYHGEDRGKPAYFAIRGTLPLDSNGYVQQPYYPAGTEPVYSIRVSTGKACTQIAKDIARRLLPGYGEMMVKAIQMVENSNRYERDTLDTYKALAAALGVPEDRLKKETGSTLYCGPFYLLAQGKSVRVERACSISREAALVMCDWYTGALQQQLTSAINTLIEEGPDLHARVQVVADRLGQLSARLAAPEKA